MDSHARRKSSLSSDEKIASLTCPDPNCQRVFSRSDHVQRHYISAHQDSRPYPCTQCDKRFARKDLLRRHLANRAVHGFRDPDILARSKRVLKACRRCASKKLKCDGDDPCGRCRKQAHKCLYEDNSSSGGISNSQHRHRTQSSGPPRSGSVSTLERDELLHHHPTAPQLVRSISPLDYQPRGGTGASSYPYRHSQQRSNSLPDPLHSPSLGGGGGDGSGEGGRTPLSISVLDSAFDDALLLLTQRHRLGLAALEFPVMDGLDFDDLDMEMLLQETLVDQQFTNLEEEDTLSQEWHRSFQQSPWQWTPQQPEYLSQEDLSEVSKSAQHSYRSSGGNHYFNNSTRDRLLACVVEALPPHERAERGVPSLPCAAMLDDLVHFSILQQSYSVDSWLHLKVQQTDTPKFLLFCALAANGAVHSSVPSVVRFGYALHEVIRKKTISILESDNTVTRNPGMVRAQVFNVGIGLWSGYSRRMETCEAIFPQMLTLIRKAGGYNSDPGSGVNLGPETSDAALHQEWERFVVGESFKRMSLHLFVEQAQISMAFHTPPVISISEMNVKLPYRRDVWNMEDAESWRECWCSEFQDPVTGSNIQIPSFMECIADIQQLMHARQYVDFPLSALAILNGYWALIHQQQELSVLSKFAPNNPMSGLNNFTQDGGPILSLLHTFKLTVLPAIPEGSQARPLLTLYHAILFVQHYIRLSLVQTFAGRFGPEASRSAREELMQGINSSKSRSAIYWAAMVLQAADEMPRGSLRDFAAVAVYHASLVLWAYGLIERGMNMSRHDRSASMLGAQGAGSEFDVHHHGETIVVLDGGQDEQIHSFITSNIGQPCITRRRNPYQQQSGRHKWLRQQNQQQLGSDAAVAAGQGAAGDNEVEDSDEDGGEQYYAEFVPLSDPVAIMDTCRTIFEVNHRLPSTPPLPGGAAGSASAPMSASAAPGSSTGTFLPTLVENLVKLTGDLGRAAAKRFRQARA